MEMQQSKTLWEMKNKMFIDIGRNCGHFILDSKYRNILYGHRISTKFINNKKKLKKGS